MSRRLSRRQFLETATGAVATASAGSFVLVAGACGCPADEPLVRARPDALRTDSLGHAPRWRGAVLQPDEGQPLIAGRRRALMRVKVDSKVALGATMSMIISQVDPGASIPVHLHRNEDELIFIHTGSGIVTLGDDRIPVSAGAVLYGPRNIWHGVDNTGSSILTWCAVYSPPGFEQFFKEVGVTPGGGELPPAPDRAAAIARKYGMVFRDA